MSSLVYSTPVAITMDLLFTWEPAESAGLNKAEVHAPWSALPWKLLGIICLITLFGSVMFYAVQIQTSVALKELGWFGFLVGVEFVGVLTIGFVYMWKKGALDWK